MKLLILTQKIDIKDDILGFMHGWIIEFAKHYEKITVIALSVGEYNLPDNVRVLSLGKDKLELANRIKQRGCHATFRWKLEIIKKFIYLINFYRYIWQSRNEYDRVFVHMNREYMVLGGIFWRLGGKKTALWYNHKKGNILSNLAGFLAGQIFYTSPFSFFAKWRKAQMMPVGIDTNFFRPDLAVKKIPNSTLFLGRISPVKKIEIFIEALDLLKKEGVNFEANIIGDAPERDRQYGEEIERKIKELSLANCVKLKKGISNRQAPAIYNQHEIFVNLTSSGSLDKTIFEAMACGCLALMSNESLAGKLDSRLFFCDNDPIGLAEAIRNAMFLDDASKQRIIVSSRDFIVQKHSLAALAKKLSGFL